MVHQKFKSYKLFFCLRVMNCWGILSTGTHLGCVDWKDISSRHKVLQCVVFLFMDYIVKKFSLYSTECSNTSPSPATEGAWSSICIQFKWRVILLFWGSQSSRAPNICSLSSVQIQKSSVLLFINHNRVCSWSLCLLWRWIFLWFWTSPKPDAASFVIFFNFQTETFDCVFFLLGL